MKVPSAVILSEAIRLYCVVETRSASVKRSDLAAVKSDGTPHPSATPPPSPNADARGRQKIDFRKQILYSIDKINTICYNKTIKTNGEYI
jgi:hypothetical protein